MKKFAYALMLTSGLMSAAFAKQNKDLVSSLETSAQTAAQTVQTSVDSALDSAIDNATAHTSNSKVLNVLAWMKSNKAATIALAAGSLVALDSLYHWIRFDSEEHDGTWFETTVTHKHVISNAKKIPNKCIGYTVALIAAVLAANDLSKDAKDSCLKQLFARLTALVSPAPTPAPVSQTPVAIDATTPAAA